MVPVERVGHPPLGRGSRMRDGTRWRGIVPPLVLLAMPVVAAYVIIFRFAINIPFVDDYWNALDFALQYQRLGSLGARLLNCGIAQHDAYKFVFLHAVVTAEMMLSGHVNMVLLSAIGDLMIVGLLAMLCRLSFVDERTLSQRLWLFVPIAWLLFRLNYSEGVAWVSSSLDYFPAMLFSLIALHLLCADDGRRPRSFVAACGFALMGCFSAPNAVLLAPLGLLLLIPRRAWLRAAAWCGVVTAGLLPYLYHYNRHSQAEADSTRTTLKLLFSFFLSFLGSGTPWQPSAMLVGAAILVVIGWAWRAGHYRTHPALLLYALWLIGSAALAAMGRSHSGVAYSLASRYRLFSDQLLIICFVFAVERIRANAWSLRLKRQIYAVTLAASMAIYTRADMLAVKSMGLHRNLLVEGLRYFEAAPETASPLYFKELVMQDLFRRQAVEARKITIEAISQGVYVPPDLGQHVDLAR